MLEQKDWDRFNAAVAVRERAPLRRRCQLLRSCGIDRANKLNVSFDRESLTTDILIEALNKNSRCRCCGRELHLEQKKGEKADDSFPILHRMDPSVGYTEPNTVIFCRRCHEVKGDATDKELELVVDFINKRLVQ